MRNYLKNIFYNVHNSMMKNCAVTNIVSTVRSKYMMFSRLLINYLSIGVFASVDIFGLILAFKASLLLGIVTAFSGPVLVLACLAFNRHYGYNFWDKFMPYISSPYLLVYWIMVGGLFDHIALSSFFLQANFNPYFSTFIGIEVMVIGGFAFYEKFIEPSLYKLIYLVAFSFCPMGLVFGLLNWWGGYNIAHLLITL